MCSCSVASDSQDKGLHRWTGGVEDTPAPGVLKGPLGAGTRQQDRGRGWERAEERALAQGRRCWESLRVGAASQLWEGGTTPVSTELWEGGVGVSSGP